MKTIVAKSYNGTQFIYNTEKHTFEMWENADTSSDHYECDEQTMLFALEVAEKEGLKEVQFDEN